MSGRRLPALLLLLVAGCRGGVLLDEGNAFLCNPERSVARGVQDPQCPPGWTCGVDGRCQLFEPDILPVDGNPVVFAADPPRVYPGELDRVYSDVATPSVDAFAALASTRTPDGGAPVFVITGQGAWRAAELPGVEVLDLAFTGQDVAMILTLPGDPSRQVRFSRSDGGNAPLFSGLVGPGTVNDAVALRGAIDPLDGGVVLYLQRRASSGLDETAGEVRFGGARNSLSEFVVLSDAGVLKALDARPVPAETFERRPPDAGLLDAFTPVVVTRSGLHYRSPRLVGAVGERWTPLTRADEEPIPLSLAPGAFSPRLRMDPTNNVFAVAFAPAQSPELFGSALSVWRLHRSGPFASLERTWTDCTPCGGASIAMFAPRFENGLPSVDVVCDVPASAAARILRVTGSAGASVFEGCAVADFTPSIDPAEIAPSRTRGVARLNGGTTIIRSYPVADYLGAGLMVGGAHGQLWRGTRFDQMRPMFLDRVPERVSTLGGKLFLLTGDYAAAHAFDGGLAVIDQRAFGGDGIRPVVPRAVPSEPAAQAAGWVVLEGAELARLTPSGAGYQVAYGPALVNPAGEAAQEPYFLEGVRFDNQDHFVVGAFDSLYLSTTETTTTRGALPSLLATLTPQPGAAIRSFVMDRSTARTSPGGDEQGAALPLARGYVVASGSVYEVHLRKQGVALSWKALPLNVGGGEPLEVFMRSDPDPQGLGRVAFRDGRILSLPSALPLVGLLPTTDEAGAPLSGRALDFANIAQLPVALTEEGLWSPGFEAGRTSYQWQAHPLPEELKRLPERERRLRLAFGKLHVAKEAEGQVLYLFTAHGFVYKLAVAPGF